MDDVFPEERLAFEVLGPASPHFQAETKFARDGYGPGDDVAAELLLKRPDGKPAAGVSLQVAAKVDDQTIFQKIAKADEGGKLRVEFALPRQLHQGRGQLIVAVEGGDRSDTITEAIPLRAGTPHVDFFPEGGLMAAGIENRVYFAARDAKGQPLEIRGEIVDGKGATRGAGGNGPRRPGRIQHHARRRGKLPAEDYQPGGHQRFAAAAAGIFAAEDRDRDGAGRLCPRRPAGVQRPRGEGPSSAGHYRPRARHARGSADARHFVGRQAGQGQRGVDSLG